MCMCAQVGPDVPPSEEVRPGELWLTVGGGQLGSSRSAERDSLSLFWCHSFKNRFDNRYNHRERSDSFAFYSILSICFGSLYLTGYI